MYKRQVYGRNIDDIRGILNARDFLLNQKESHPEMVEELMRPAYFVPETVPASQLFKDMQKKKVHIAIVVDE